MCGQSREGAIRFLDTAIDRQTRTGRARLQACQKSRREAATALPKAGAKSEGRSDLSIAVAFHSAEVHSPHTQKCSYKQTQAVEDDEPRQPLQYPHPRCSLISSMSSRNSFTSFTLCYWRHPAASGVLACISENT
jgi:hypothetical protein